MNSYKQLEVQFDDPNPQKWCHPLTQDVFSSMMSKENSIVQKIFGLGSIFSPLLFGKFFDPSDAFPLWEFDSDVLVANLSGLGQRSVDWFQTEIDYVLKAELPGHSMVQVSIINGEILEISGQLKQQQKESGSTRDWKSNHWWEHGFVRRLELPDQTGWKKSEAYVKNDVFLEIKIPKKAKESDVP